MTWLIRVTSSRLRVCCSTNRATGPPVETKGPAVTTGIYASRLCPPNRPAQNDRTGRGQILGPTWPAARAGCGRCGRSPGQTERHVVSPSIRNILARRGRAAGWRERVHRASRRPRRRVCGVDGPLSPIRNSGRVRLRFGEPAGLIDSREDRFEGLSVAGCGRGLFSTALTMTRYSLESSGLFGLSGRRQSQP